MLTVLWSVTGSLPVALCPVCRGLDCMYSYCVEGSFVEGTDMCKLQEGTEVRVYLVSIVLLAFITSNRL